MQPGLTHAPGRADILSELDEMEREEFFRLKKIQDKKADRLAAEKLKNDAYEALLLEKGIVRGNSPSLPILSCCGNAAPVARCAYHHSVGSPRSHAPASVANTYLCGTREQTDRSVLSWPVCRYWAVNPRRRRRGR